ncbi:MAG: acyl-CoA dehydrogenase [Candidatus Glassbacteria bacterium RBG_16_58_8]|uniref:Acyl-CoA dehydrogenase n=1 Tax=Candidatus Glassbacteria bacterium RBG_16_58_8 TaxID=1817866 RepID=A0A1F5YAB6_9BACT|nr:MAG: acyl-CoA dehydrogenase [Candidatus Glassbacteria bacterium RBG_16_58_8]
MDFTFTEEQQMLRETVRKFTEKDVKPLARQIDTEKKIPEELLDTCREMGLFGILIPEEYGGIGAGDTGYCIVTEEIARGSSSLAVYLGAHQSIGAMAIILDGTEEQKKRFLPAMATGEKVGAFALTEPNAGSDASSLESTAERRGDHFVVNGTKIWITNGNVADVISLFVGTPRKEGQKGGVTALIVESTMPGFKVGAVDDKMGIRGASSSELIFEDMIVPAETLLGREGKGFATAMKTLDHGRLGIAAMCIGVAKEALRLSVEHAKGRIQFGRPIAELQAIQWMIAEIAAETYAMESMAYRTAWMADRGDRVTREGAIAKMFTSECLDRIVDKALQIHGGMGYMRDYPIEMFYRDSRINRIFEGTNEIQRLIIARDVLKRGGY